MTWAIIILLFILFLLGGIYVVSGRWEAAMPKRDAKALESWRKIKSLGFWIFTVRGPLPWAFAYVFAGVWTGAWRHGHRLVLTKEEVVSNALWSIALGLILGASQWFLQHAAADEARERAKRAIQNETDASPDAPADGAKQPRSA